MLLKLLKKYPTAPWDRNGLSRNPGITWAFILGDLASPNTNFINEWDYGCIFTNSSIRWNDVYRFLGLQYMLETGEMGYIFHNTNLTLQDIEDMVKDSALYYYIGWKQLSCKSNKISWEDMYRTLDRPYYNWNLAGFLRKAPLSILWKLFDYRFLKIDFDVLGIPNENPINTMILKKLAMNTFDWKQLKMNPNITMKFIDYMNSVREKIIRGCPHIGNKYISRGEDKIAPISKNIEDLDIDYIEAYRGIPISTLMKCLYADLESFRMLEIDHLHVISMRKDFKYRYINKYPNLKWHRASFSKNLWLKFDFVKQTVSNKTITWDWDQILANPACPIQDVLDFLKNNPHLIVLGCKTVLMYSNPRITMKMIKSSFDLSDECWARLSANKFEKHKYFRFMKIAKRQEIIARILSDRLPVEMAEHIASFIKN
jgi:hypothetical protein